MFDSVTLSGIVADIFAHRFTLTSEGRTILADLGPKGAERVRLAPGDAVTIRGERKPSEIKVHGLTRGGETIEIPHGDKHKDHKHGHHPAADPEVARAAAAAAGLRPVGEPRRKPQHFELVARDAEGRHHELHVALDGRLRKRKPVASEGETGAGAPLAA